ncbi:T9SS type A sorting domain-containing protein [Dyadobacter sp. CY323]|uniref:T9SS type A sorting domain-containing protein n=1 Tax=Dyadobacter sp. CY323 TaxID=2907302 RepID=UPI001F42C551|nr:T9SS type A sorting domain-containing protein [Dyadobacter sp. CY323]MCE6992662.1 T9SS type A sorting domain-containing protein [Dyadobacter sp. CY323]
MGGYVYRGSKYGSLNGYYFFGDYQSGKIGLISPAGVGTFPAGLSYSSLISFGEDHAGELYVLSFLNGTLSKITNPNDPLPVQLAYFRAKAENLSVILEWRMASAHNFKEFQLQRSKDGRKFENIATLPDAGIEHTYSFRDNQPMSGENFYRLKIADQDGSYQFSKIVRAGLSDAGSSITIFPNPSTGIFNVKSLKDECLITLRGTSGKVIFTKRIRSENDIEINLENHPAGTYTIRIVNQATKISETRHLVKE